jgi:hypothetical protein
MLHHARCLSYGLLVALGGAGWALPQEQAKSLTPAEEEEFLLNAKVLKRQPASKGITGSERATLSDGKTEHYAHIQAINEEKPSFTSSHGTELNFKDSYKYNIAAYRLGKILGIDSMIPVSVDRKVGGKTSAVTWWVDDVLMDEEKRNKTHADPPDKDNWNKQMYAVRVFDQLIYNTDRNLGNLLIDKKWNIWMIDHTRAFRLQNKLMSEKDLVMCDRKLLANLRKLDEDTLMEQLKPVLSKSEIKAILQRRDLIVKFFDKEIAAKGESAVLYDLPPRA